MNEVKSGKPLPQLKGYCYTVSDVYKARDDGKILCLRLDTNYNCNLRCIYCYSDQNGNFEEPFQADIRQVRNYIDQVAEYGLRSVVYLGGGEPFAYRHFDELILYLYKKNIVPVIFTNGVLMTRDKAAWLYDLNASIMIKNDGCRRTQDYLTGEGTYECIQKNIRNLLDLGFAKMEGSVTRLGIAPAACTPNFLEMTDIWRFCRQNNIFPNVERVTAIEERTRNLQLTENHMEILLKRLRDIDEVEFGLQWHTPFSAIPAHSCFIYLAGLHITADGGVSACPEMKPAGNLNQQSLRDILSSGLFQSIRQLEKNLDEPCYSCDYKIYCLGGCRSKAVQSTGSHFAPDPTCWFAKEWADKKEKEDREDILIAYT